MLQALPEDTDLGLYLSCLRAAIDKMELQFAAVAADFAGAEQWDDEGANSAADWLRFHCHMTSGAAWNALQVGKQLSKLPQSLEALRQGEIGYAHLATLANTADKVKGFEESELLPLAKEHSPGKFHYQVLHYRHARERQAYEREQEDLFQARSLNLSTAQDGCLLISGVLDPVAGAAVRGALEPLARPSGEHDDRRREQRLADALYERVTGNTPVSLQVTATVETLKALAGAAGGEMEFSLPLPAATVQRLACDSSVMRVLFEADSLPVDVGRSPAPGRRRSAQGPGGARQALPVAGLRASGLLVRRPSPGALGRRRRDQPREHGPALQAPPPHGPRGRMEADQGRGQDREHRPHGDVRPAPGAGLAEAQ